MRTLGHSQGLDFLRFLIKLTLEKLQVSELQVPLLLLAERADSYNTKTAGHAEALFLFYVTQSPMLTRAMLTNSP